MADIARNGTNVVLGGSITGNQGRAHQHIGPIGHQKFIIFQNLMVFYAEIAAMENRIQELDVNEKMIYHRQKSLYDRARRQQAGFNGGISASLPANTKNLECKFPLGQHFPAGQSYAAIRAEKYLVAQQYICRLLGGDNSPGKIHGCSGTGINTAAAAGAGLPIDVYTIRQRQRIAGADSGTAAAVQTGFWVMP